MKLFEGVHKRFEAAFHLHIASSFGPGAGTGSQRGHKQQNVALPQGSLICRPTW